MDSMDDSYADAHSNDDHHEGWQPGDDVWHGQLTDEQGIELPF
jgi:hypothetical protein